MLTQPADTHRPPSGTATAAPRLFVAACQNGLGHFVRTARILGALVELSPSVHVTWACGRWQLDALGDDPVVSALRAQCDFVFIDDHPLRLTTFGGRSDDDGSAALREADRILFTHPACQAADVVWSDNLVGVLAHRPDAVLSGSFLWSDVFEADAQLASQAAGYIEHERALLARHRPPMFALDTFCMPGVVERTDVVRCGLMPDPSAASAPADGDRVVLFGGAAGLAQHRLASVAAALTAAGYDLTAPARLKLEAAPFDFSPAAWGEVGTAICRPGIGTIHDCVKRGVPMIALYDVANVELRHNAQRLAALGLGVDAGDDAVAAAAAVPDVNARRKTILAAMAALPTSGCVQVATALANRLFQRTAPVAEDL